jgi:hypothetical protein
MTALAIGHRRRLLGIQFGYSSSQLEQQRSTGKRVAALLLEIVQLRFFLFLGCGGGQQRGQLSS